MKSDVLIEVRAAFFRKGDKACAQQMADEYAFFSEKDWEDALDDLPDQPAREPDPSDKDRWHIEGASDRDFDVVLNRDLIAFDFATFGEGRCDTRYMSGIDAIRDAIGWAEMMDPQREELVADAKKMFDEVMHPKPLSTNLGEIMAVVRNAEDPVPQRWPVELVWIGVLGYECRGGDGYWEGDDFEDWAEYRGRVPLDHILAIAND